MPRLSYNVTDMRGNVHQVKADMVFNIDGVLMFRSGKEDDAQTEAAFAPGQWSSYVLVHDDDKS